MGNRSSKKCKIILPGEGDAYDDYVSTFVQRIPRYCVKRIGRGHWRTKAKSLGDLPIKAHLAGRYAVATVGRWYPEYAILDIDSRSHEEVEELRDAIGLDESNSMFYSSESEDHYHLLLRPEYKGRPPTLKLLRDALKTFETRYGIEVYPQERRTVRLPFGPYQRCLDLDYRHLTTYQDKLYWFNKLDPFDLSAVPKHQLRLQLDLDLTTPFDPREYQGYFHQGKFLFEEGLQRSSSRHESQFAVLYYLYRMNVPLAEAKRITWVWIRQKHHGFSKAINQGKFDLVKRDIESLADWIYSHYDLSQYYPDSTHNLFRGRITEPDLRDIIGYTNGSLPRMRFLFQIVKFMYPRRHWIFVNISRNLLVQWSSTETYLTYLRELEEKGVVKRGTAYRVSTDTLEGFAKDFKLNWNYRTVTPPIMVEGRGVRTFEDAVRKSYRPEEFRELLKGAGVERTTAIKMCQRIWKFGAVMGEFVITSAGKLIEIDRWKKQENGRV